MTKNKSDKSVELEPIKSHNRIDCKESEGLGEQKETINDNSSPSGLRWAAKSLSTSLSQLRINKSRRLRVTSELERSKSLLRRRASLLIRSRPKSRKNEWNLHIKNSPNPSGSSSIANLKHIHGPSLNGCNSSTSSVSPSSMSHIVWTHQAATPPAEASWIRSLRNSPFLPRAYSPPSIGPGSIHHNSDSFVVASDGAMLGDAKASGHKLKWTRAVISKPAPAWTATAIMPSQPNGSPVIKELKLADYRGKYLILLFYPLDFTFVCPTEILAFSDRIEEFRKINADVVGCSVDSHYTHVAWIQTARSQGGLGHIKFPLLSDMTHSIAMDYGVYLESNGHALRGLFIIDPKGIVRQITMNDLPVGRSVDETLRLIQALQYTDKHGEVCPANWQPGSDTIIPDPEGKIKYFEARNSAGGDLNAERDTLKRKDKKSGGSGKRSGPSSDADEL